MRKKGKKKKDKDNKMTPFEKIISEVAAEYTGEKYLEECMKFPVDAKERIARRHRLIYDRLSPPELLEEAKPGCGRM